MAVANVKPYLSQVYGVREPELDDSVPWEPYTDQQLITRLIFYTDIRHEYVIDLSDIRDEIIRRGKEKRAKESRQK